MERRISPRFIALSLSLGLALAAVPVEATDNWTVAGSPSGGFVYKVVVDPSAPSTLYATSGTGVYKSTDSGATWALVFASIAPNDIVLDPLAPATLYVAITGYPTKSIFKTTDGGATWNAADNGIATSGNANAIDFVYGLSVDPVDEGTLYAATLNTGLYKSTDGGANWSPINTGLSAAIQAQGVRTAPSVDPVNPQVLYLPTGWSNGGGTSQPDTGLFQSTDGGAHWTQSVTGVGFDRVTIDPSNHNTVYAGGGGGVYVSTNGGTNWSGESSWPTMQDIAAVDPSNSLHLLGSGFFNGVFESIDGGSTWSQTSPANGMYTWSVTLDPGNTANVYLATDWGIFKSTDSGATWAASTAGIHNVIPSLMVEGADGIVYMASANNGIYKSTDQGVTWTEIGSGVTGSLPIIAENVYALVQDPTANSILYAGTISGIYKSIDGGNTWTQTNAGISTTPYVLGMAIDPEVPTTLYVCVNPSSPTIYKSVDGGASWAASGNGLPSSLFGFQALAVDPHNSQVVYAGDGNGVLFKSIDGGASWQPETGVTDVQAITVDPQHSNIVYAVGIMGLFKSTDAGVTWAPLGNLSNISIENVNSIKIDPANTSIIYMSQRFGAGDAYVSSDAGVTWYDLTTLSTPQAATRSVQHTRSLMEGAPVARGAGTASWAITAAVMGSQHPNQLLGGASDGQVYSIDISKLPTTQSQGGGSTGGSSASKGSSGGSGGGDFSLLLIFGLGAFAAKRKR